MSTAQPQPEEQKNGFGFNAWQFMLLIGLVLVVYVMWRILSTHPKHPLEIGGTFFGFMGVAFSGIGITISYRKDTLDIKKLTEIKEKVAAEKYSLDVLHGKLDELMHVLIENAKERRNSGAELKWWYLMSLVTSAIGTAILITVLLQ